MLALQKLGHIREMKKKYKNISAEVTPHHLFFNDDALKDYDTNLKVAPPIRTENDRKSLIKAVADGTIDCIATDHAPHSIDEKETTFDLACFGMIGLESAFGAANMVLVEESGLKIIDLISLFTVNPRRIMGFNSDLSMWGNWLSWLLLTLIMSGPFRLTIYIQNLKIHHSLARN